MSKTAKPDERWTRKWSCNRLVEVADIDRVLLGPAHPTASRHPPISSSGRSPDGIGHLRHAADGVTSWLCRCRSQSDGGHRSGCGAVLRVVVTTTWCRTARSKGWDMAVVEAVDRDALAIANRETSTSGSGPPRDLQRTFQLILATIWLLDAVLQIQPFMFTRGSNGFSGMLNGLASGNPSWVGHTITWNGSIVYHEPILTNTSFALIQFVIGFGIVWKKSCKPALALSIVWALGVWWFGEGSGGVFQGAATPFGGGPGAVLFYAILAVLLWPSEGSNTPFLAARTVGPRVARAIWVAVWGLFALLSVVGSGRSPQALHDLVVRASTGQPGWLTHIDRVSES